MFGSISEALVRLGTDETGAAAAEYAVLVALIAVAVAGAVVAFDLDGIFGALHTQVVNCFSGNC